MHLSLICVGYPRSSCHYIEVDRWIWSITLEVQKVYRKLLHFQVREKRQYWSFRRITSGCKGQLLHCWNPNHMRLKDVTELCPSILCHCGKETGESRCCHNRQNKFGWVCNGLWHCWLILWTYKKYLSLRNQIPIPESARVSEDVDL